MGLLGIYHIIVICYPHQKYRLHGLEILSKDINIISMQQWIIVVWKLIVVALLLHLHLHLVNLYLRAGLHLNINLIFFP